MKTKKEKRKKTKKKLRKKTSQGNNTLFKKKKRKIPHTQTRQCCALRPTTSAFIQLCLNLAITSHRHPFLSKE